MAEGFTCDADWKYRFVCEGLDFYGEHEGKRYCVLHFPGEEKKDDFNKVKESKLARKDYRFNGTVFPEGTSIFEGFEFDASANFAGATFIGGAQFRDATFSGEQTDFSDAQFSGEGTSFSRASFAQRTSFFGASFSGGGGLLRGCI